MGEVYKATDTNLKRAVAIKVLPASVAADAERLARFQREAEVLAALNHPNIAAIYGLERSGPTTALVMELVEGPTLADRIAQGAIPIDEALPIAKQIAEALEAAHEQNIIHRDLKPANIKVRADGTVKVLDFGLAKAMEPTGAVRVDATNSPTMSMQATMAGVILGTAAYMSPEQARGRPVDKRSDIWAFGAVLFEMLTGQRAFGGEDVQDTFVAIVRDEPDWPRLPATLSPTLRIYLRRCLHKNPKQRIADVQDLRLALAGAFEPAAPPPTVMALSSSGGRQAWMAFAVAALAAAALAVPAVRYLRETPPPETRVEINTPATDQPTMFALSPDGRRIVFVASGDGASRLWLRSLVSTTAQPLVGTEGARSPFWSPDSRSIGFVAGGTLKRLDLGGGAPQTLAPVTGYGGTWSADGVIVFAPGPAGPLARVSTTGGTATAVTTLGPQQVNHRWPQMLPDGHRFLFYAQSGTPEVAGIYLGTLDGTAPTRLTGGDGYAAYLASGWVLWVRAGTLVAQRLDLKKAALTGEPVTLADGVAVDGFSLGGAVSVAATGLVAYRTGSATRRQLGWFDRAGTARGFFGDPDGSNLFHPRMSPDGRRVAVTRTVQGNTDIWLLDGARASRVTFDAAFDDSPLWSSDGSRIVFRSSRTGPGDLYQKLTSGAGVEERLVASDQAKTPTSWSADGRFLLYHSLDPLSGPDLWVVPIVGDRTPSLILKTPFTEVYGVFSPDSRWVAYSSNESGRNEIYVRPFVLPNVAGTAAGAGGGQWQVSTAGGIYPVWRPDGKELYYVNPAGTMMAAPITVSGATLEPGAPVVLFPTRIYGGGVDAAQQGRQYDVAHDGRFLINTELDSAAAPITLLMNWQPEVKK